MSAVIDFPFGIEDLEKIFEVSDLLENKETLVEEFRPEVQKYLVKDDFFHGIYRAEYKRAFNDLIISLIKRQFIKHFPHYTPEELLILTDLDFLKMITNDFYFKESTYKISKEGNENEPKNSLH